MRENLSLQKRVTRKENNLKKTSLEKKEITKKLRGAKCATTKLKNQLKEKVKVVNTKYSLADTFAHGKNGANQRTVMFMACIRYLQHACLLSKLLNEIKEVATSHETCLINKETTPHLFEFYKSLRFTLILFLRLMSFPLLPLSFPRRLISLLYLMDFYLQAAHSPSFQFLFSICVN